MPRYASAEPTWTMVPRSRGSIRRSAARVPNTYPWYVTSVTRRYSSGSMSMNLANTEVKATFTQTSMGPSSCSTLAAAWSTAWWSATSVGMASAFPPACPPPRRAASRPSTPRASRATLSPRAPNARAVALPMPPDAPVTTTTCGFFLDCMCLLSSVTGWLRAIRGPTGSHPSSTTAFLAQTQIFSKAWPAGLRLSAVGRKLIGELLGDQGGDRAADSGHDGPGSEEVVLGAQPHLADGVDQVLDGSVRRAQRRRVGTRPVDRAQRGRHGPQRRGRRRSQGGAERDGPASGMLALDHEPGDVLDQERQLLQGACLGVMAVREVHPPVCPPVDAA